MDTLTDTPPAPITHAEGTDPAAWLAAARRDMQDSQAAMGDLRDQLRALPVNEAVRARVSRSFVRLAGVMAEQLYVQLERELAAQPSAEGVQIRRELVDLQQGGPRMPGWSVHGPHTSADVMVGTLPRRVVMNDVDHPQRGASPAWITMLARLVTLHAMAGDDDAVDPHDEDALLLELLVARGDEIELQAAQALAITDLPEDVPEDQVTATLARLVTRRTGRGTGVRTRGVNDPVPEGDDGYVFVEPVNPEA